MTDGANWIRTAYPVYQLRSIVVDTIRAGNVLTASPNQNISLTGNFTADSGDDAVWFSNVSGGTVSGNYFLNPNINPAGVRGSNVWTSAPAAGRRGSAERHHR